ncbi:hypothetical protein [Geomonas oryzae]|uniref:hypothetical protein n=1 Tax=Geomonas oryzae TaxID=2364273 RepID=UPI001FE6DF75|nr:hypothetical protein [Geomonas oryzae]
MALFQAFLAAVLKHDAVHNQSIMGNRLLIMERDELQRQLVVYLEQIALHLEMAAISKPEVFSASGFDLSRDKRGHGRGKAVNAALGAAQSEQEGGEGGTSS